MFVVLNGTSRMVKHCCVVGCTADERKYGNLNKNHWMRGVTFWSFPSVIRARTAHYLWINAVKRDNSWRPNHQTRTCSRHFVGGLGPTVTLSRHCSLTTTVRRLPLSKNSVTVTDSSPRAVSVLLVPIHALDIGCEVTIDGENDSICTGKIAIEKP